MKQLRYRLFIFALITGLAWPSLVFARTLFVQSKAAQAPAGQQGNKYPTVGMHKGKLSVDKSRGIIYFNAQQREERRLIFRDGLVYDHTGQTLVTTRSKHQNQNNYVMDAAGNFYLFDEFTHPEIRHSSIFAGGPVAGAGNITIQAGHVTYIDSDSGHYPSTNLFGNVQQELAARGVSVGGQHQKTAAVAETAQDTEGKKGKKDKKEKKGKKKNKHAATP